MKINVHQKLKFSFPILLIAYCSRGLCAGYCLEKGAVISEVGGIILFDTFKW